MQIKQNPFFENGRLILMVEDPENHEQMFGENGQENGLRRALNAWKKAEEKTIINDIIALTNKITKGGFEEQKIEFIDHLRSVDEERMRRIVDLIFERSIEEPTFCQIYVDLCKAKIDDDHSKARKSRFSDHLLERSQRLFQFLFDDQQFSEDKTLLEHLVDAKLETEKLYDNQSLSPTERRKLKSEFAELEAKLKWKQSGFINFLGHLYLAGLVNERIIFESLKGTLQVLFRVPKPELPWRDEKLEDCLSAFCSLWKVVAERLASNLSQEQNEVLSKLIKYLHNRRDLASNRIRFAIMDAYESAQALLGTKDE